MGGCTCETHFAIFFLGLLFLFPDEEEQYDPIPGNVISHLTYFPIQENALSERNNNNRNNGIKSDSIKGRYRVSGTFKISRYRYCYYFFFLYIRGKGS